MKFRKKPVVVEAVRWNGTPKAFHAIQELSLAGNVPIRELMAPTGLLVEALVIGMLEGDMRAELGDWVIRGVRNEVYPCKPDIFEETYEDLAPGHAETSDYPSIEGALRDLLNRHSAENASDTPDFMLASYLVRCLEAYNATVLARERWYGRHREPTGGTGVAPVEPGTPR